MAITEVIRRGNQRRTRALAQRSIGGLSAVGLGAAVLFTGVTHHPHSNPAASSATTGGNTLAVSSNSAAGNLTMTVKYRDLSAGKIRVMSVAYSGDIKKPPKHSSVVLEFGPGLAPDKSPRSITFVFGAELRPGQHHFSGSLSGKSLSFKSHHLVLLGNGSLRIAVGAGHFVSTGTKKPANRNLTAVVILTR